MNIESNDEALEAYVIALFSLTINALAKRLGISLEAAAAAGMQYSETITAEELAGLTITCMDTHLKAGGVIPKDFHFHPLPQPTNRAQRRAAKRRRR